MSKQEIDQLRNKINLIDETIVKLISERIDCAVKIGLLKDELRKIDAQNSISAYDPIRESQILTKLKSIPSKISDRGIDLIFKQIISLCRNSAHQATVCVYSQSDSVDFSKHFGDFCFYEGFNDPEKFINALKSNEFNIAVVEDNFCKAIEKELKAIDFEYKDIYNNSPKDSLIYKIFVHR